MIGEGPEQPDYTLQRNFLPAPEFAALRAELLERRPVLAQHHLDQGYNAVNVNFNLAGAPSRIVAASTFPHLGFAGLITLEKGRRKDHFHLHADAGGSRSTPVTGLLAKLHGPEKAWQYDASWLVSCPVVHHSAQVSDYERTLIQERMGSCACRLAAAAPPGQ